MFRAAAAWVFFGMGHAVYVVFDRWLPWGMVWPIYRTYGGLMSLSGWAQGNGAGPWTYVLPDATEKVT